MEKEITPHREAVLSAKRTVVNNPNRNTPKACEASTSKTDRQTAWAVYRYYRDSAGNRIDKHYRRWP